MKRIASSIVIALAVLVVAMSARNGPIALDWHKGGHLYVLHKNGSVSILDEITKKKLATIPPTFGMEPAEIFSAELKNREFVFVSGFAGRAGVVHQYTADGKLTAKFDTPEQAASFDVDPVRQLLYVTSPVTNVVYAMRIDQKGSAPKRAAYIREAAAVGPVIYDQGRNRVLVGDAGNGVLYDVDVRTGSYQPIASNLGRPISLAIGSQFKTLFLADSKASLVHVFRLENGAFKLAETIPTGLQKLAAVGLGPDDTIFVADGSAVYQLSLKTKKLSRVMY